MPALLRSKDEQPHRPDEAYRYAYGQPLQCSIDRLQLFPVGLSCLVVELPKIQLRRRTSIGLEHFAHLGQRVGIIIGIARGHTVSRHDEAKVTHVSIVGREEDTDIAGNACQNERIGFEIVESAVHFRQTLEP